MARSVRVLVTGIKSVDRKLAALGPKVANGVVRKAIREGAKEFAADLKLYEPEGPTKALKRSIIVRAGKRSRKGYTMQVGYDMGKFKAKKWHATFSEWGTHKMRGDHAMLRAYDVNKGRIGRGIVRRIKAGIKEAH